MHRTLIVLALWFLAACFVSGCAAPVPPSAKEPSAQGAHPSDLLESSLRGVFGASSLLVLGEVHGTNEVPSFALAAVEATLASWDSVALGLEMDSAHQGAVDTYLASAGGAESREALLQADHWKFGAADGRGSLAMLGLIEGVRSLRAKGLDVGIHCFQGFGEGDGPGQFEASMANSVGEFLGRNASTKLIVLVGNAHARTLPLEPGAALPMGHFLKEISPNLVTLDMRSAGGESWVWTDLPGVQGLGGTGEPGAFGIELFGAPGDGGFHGVFDVGVVTASLPARPEALEQLLEELGLGGQ